MAGEVDLSLVRREHPSDQVEDGRFPGAVRAKQTEDFPLRHMEGEAVDGAKTAERFAQSLYFE
jgi:hypothetical protein